MNTGMKIERTGAIVQNSEFGTPPHRGFAKPHPYRPPETPYHGDRLTQTVIQDRQPSARPSLEE